MQVLLFLQRIPLDFLSLISEEVTNPDNPVVFQRFIIKAMFQTRTIIIVKHVGELIPHKERLCKQKVCSYRRREGRDRVDVK